MEWMYRGVSGLADREEYLKGRKIDKTFEIIDKEENGLKGDLDSFAPQIPESVLQSNKAQTVTVDLAAKLREDPLYEIRVRQRDQRRKIFDNPLKLKKLKKMLETNISEDKDKKHKKKSKRDRSEGRYSNSKGRSGDTRVRPRSDSPESDTSQHNRHNRHKYKDYKEKDYRNKYDKLEEKNKSRNYFEHSYRRSDTKHKCERLSAEDLERKRLEMMDNAVWRETNRKSNVKTFEDQERQENQFNRSSHSAQFIKPLLKNATENDSLEKRLKQKRFTSQRSYNSMDSNFAKK